MAKIIFIFMNLEYSVANIFSKCLQCHNQKNKNSVVVNGQNYFYIEKQLYDFKFKNRVHPFMNQIAQSLSNQDIKDVSNFFSAMKWTNSSDANYGEDEILKGQNLVAQLNCAGCHRQDFKGFERTPRIRGQNLKYLQSQLVNFRNQIRKNDSGLMYAYTQFLTDDDINAISIYLSSLKN